MNEARSRIERLRNFGDPRLSWRWKTGEVDYVATLHLTADDVAELIAIARQWTAEPVWPADPADMSPYAPIHAWRALAQLRADQATAPLLDMLAELDARGDDWYPQELPRVFAWIGLAAAPLLAGYLADAANGEFPRACAACGLKELAMRHPQARAEAAEALTAALLGFRRSGAALNSFLVRYLREMDEADAPAAAGAIQQAVAAGAVNADITGAWRG